MTEVKENQWNKNFVNYIEENIFLNQMEKH